ncbi:MAG: hypothetical protein KZQ64_00305 [gamma proteobacterium symbiont of Bathyaustriella thionipta]|nr:hypothetical protein [gamma proteobacterium symbiont of Bathyaustriella thionipta]MCU7950536.1 hypothetical protein [gamma proteobacterium symbiont of Bathyaustriella thionipta]MCU7951850.1 hypothetical protein [gamma proteobacterium symbiont of Bathyaustriella thionipta]MCU7957030.1 hypothetical protein [gamma proteobacterium symbiont of Bathyaustriella thionipta]MCU7968858.1 hypothetical protein [gamma proteobacterium symbiont of Bathyaustriella thionipta]
MKNTKLSSMIALIILPALSLLTAAVSANSMDTAVQDLQKQWAIANYETAEADLDKTFTQLTEKAEQAVKDYPQKAEPLIWNAIIVSSDAGKTGGFGALGKVKKARKLLLEAEKINPDALHGSIYTSLGSLYYQVPGWPIGFGNDDKAEEYLKKALLLNPDGIDSNYFYGDFLLDQGKKEEASTYFNKALKAPARPQRPLADKGRQNEIQAKLKTMNQ